MTTNATVTHGGDVPVRGATFHVLLPVAQSPRRTSDTIAQPLPDGTVGVDGNDSVAAFDHICAHREDLASILVIITSLTSPMRRALQMSALLRS